MRSFFFAIVGFVAASLVSAADVPDTLQDGDDWNSGYNPNHNIDPEVVKSGRFGILWSLKPSNNGGAERFMAKPLVYTDESGRSYLIAAASSNRVYVIDAKSGATIKTRQLRKPYSNEEVTCGDLIPENGILGTPVIDKESRTLYVYAKGFKSDEATGPFDAVMYLYAIDVLTLEDRENFPVLVGGPATNDPVRYFTGGLGLQRPSLKLLNGFVFAGFGGGCGSFNQTGWIASVHAKTGKLATLFATQAGPKAPSVDGWYAGGGGGSIWQAGTGFATDRKDRLFMVSGDGKVFDGSYPPMPGSEPGQILEGVLLNVKVNGDGTVTPQDHFRPAVYGDLGSSARDVGSGGVTMLDPKYFAVPGVGQIALIGGMDGTVTVVNVDQLGGYQQGPNRTDKAVQTFPVPGNVRGLIYGSFGSYPEGGYAYIRPVGLRSVIAYKFEKEGPQYFKLAGQSQETAVTAVGSGAPLVTTNKGKAGTALVWVADINKGLQVYDAVPEDGILKEITIPQLGRPKFMRPTFRGDMVYIVTQDGMVIAYGTKPEGPTGGTKVERARQWRA